MNVFIHIKNEILSGTNYTHIAASLSSDSETLGQNLFSMSNARTDKIWRCTGGRAVGGSLEEFTAMTRAQAFVTNLIQQHEDGDILEDQIIECPGMLYFIED